MDSRDYHFPLLKTKWHIPRARGNLVARSHLIDRLNSGLDRRLTLLCAPPGYGKTTLLSQWLMEGSRPVAWLTLDENDNDLVVFLSYLLGTLEKLSPGIGWTTLSLMEAPQRPPLEYTTSVLIHELSEIPDSFVLVLDDYQTISNNEIHQLIDALITYMPPEMHLVIASRTEVPLPLVRLRIGRQMTDIRLMELRFSEIEVGEYFEKETGREFNQETIALLENRTEGWIAALRLVAMALRSDIDAGLFVRDFKGSHRDLMDYLLNEVISDLPQDVHEFLLQTSVLDQFCAPLCDAIRGSSSDSQSILDFLEENNLFLIPLDDEHRWYRYHRLFRELLNHRLRLTEAEKDIKEYHHQAGRWLEEQRDYEAAVHHYIAASELELAVKIVERQYLNIVNREAWWEADHWLGILPIDVVNLQPSLQLMQCWSLLLKFHLDAIPPLLERVEDLLAEGIGNHTIREVETMRADVDVLWSFLSFIAEGNAQKSLKFGERALEKLPTSYATGRGLALAMVSMAKQEMGHGEDAIRALFEKLSDSASHDAVIMQAYITLCFIHLSNADLPKLYQIAFSFLEAATELGQSPEIAWANYFLGLTHYEWNELDKASLHFSEGIDLRYRADFLTSHLNMLGEAIILNAKGDSEAAFNMCADLRTFSLEMKSTFYFPEVDSMQARFQLDFGDLLSTKRWAESISPDIAVDNFYAIEIPYLTWARIQIRDGEASGIEKVVEILHLRLREAEETHKTRRQIQIYSILALAYWELGRSDEALSALKKAIQLAKQGRFLRTFIDLNGQIIKMLQQLILQGKDVEYVSTILASFTEGHEDSSIEKLDAVSLARKSSKRILVDPLTMRESEILLLLDERQTNQEIAENLTISIPTVKKHIGNLYQKLGVSRRNEAVDKAKDLGILSSQ